LALPSFVLSADPPGAGIVATFTVNAGTSERHDTPVSASLQGIAFDPARPSLKLHERTGEKRVPVASQVDTEFVPRLWWILEGVTPAGTERVFELFRESFVEAAEDASDPPTAVEDDGDALTVTLRGRPVLRYRYTPVAAPPGTSPLYARSGAPGKGEKC
jgi:hypothetical protein